MINNINTSLGNSLHESDHFFKRSSSSHTGGSTASADESCEVNNGPFESNGSKIQLKKEGDTSIK